MGAEETFDIKKFAQGLVNPVTWSKTVVYMVIGSIILVILLGIKSYFFPPKKNINKPITWVAPFAKVEKIDNTNTQVTVEKERPWEVGAGIAGLTYDNKTGAIAGVMVKRKF